MGGSTNNNAATVFAVVAGVAYTGLGIIGFAFANTGFVADTGESFIGFDLNIFHNIVHLAIGVGFLVASRLDDTITQGVIIGGGLVYVLAALLGFLNQLQILSIDESLAPVSFLHIVSGSAAIIFGLIGARQTDELVERGSRGARNRPSRA